MRRREVMFASLALPVAAWAQTRLPPAAQARHGDAAPFDEATVPTLARSLSAAPYQPPQSELPEWLQQLGYDRYRDIRYDPAQALWRQQGLPYQLQLFHRGFLFKERVEVHTVADGVATPLFYRPGQFQFIHGGRPRRTGDLGYAGFRLHGPLNRADYYDEIAAFLGASYFRALGKGHSYGISARGLALRTAHPAGEEFPLFRAFWIEQPAPGADHMVVHALLDGPSVSGAWRFVIRPGQDTVFETTARLYPRVDLTAVGIAPLTSMYQFAANDRVGVDDYRQAVHDSDGLALWTGTGEQIWRPLHNPAVLQDAGFEDHGPRAFGLMQRRRQFLDYADSEARYESRPSLWVEPLDDWGAGAVHLVEIPTPNEYHDNIVAFWRPAEPLRAHTEYRYDYRLHWCDGHSWRPGLATVADTRIGASWAEGRRQVIVDFAGQTLQGLGEDDGVQADVWARQGRVLNPVAHPVPATGGWRIGFELDPAGARAVELHARLLRGRTPISETWLYRWTA